MPQIEPFLNLYIDANIVLALAFLIWGLTLFAIRRSRFGGDFRVQLRLTEGLMLAALLSPLVALCLAQMAAVLFPGRSLNMADIAVAQFLDGRVQMEAVEFETLLGVRQGFVEDLADLRTPVAWALAAFLAGGFALGMGRVALNALRLRRLIAASYVWRRFGTLELRLSDRTAIPFSTRGLRRRYIVLPATMLAQPKALRIALSHELQHMRRWDIEWELVLAFLQPLFFWNPFFQRWKRKLEHLRELGCDQALISRNRVTRRDYADCLLTVCEQSLARGQHFAPVSPKVPLLNIPRTLTGRRNTQSLRERIAAIASAPVRASAGRSLALWPLLLAATVAIGLGASTMRKPGDWSQDRLMLSTIVNLERLEQRSTGLSLEGY